MMTQNVLANVPKKPTVIDSKATNNTTKFSEAMNTSATAAKNTDKLKTTINDSSTTAKTTSGTAKSAAKLASEPKKPSMTAAESIKIYGTGTLEDLQARIRNQMSFRIPTPRSGVTSFVPAAKRT